ncbi:MAG: flagellar hook capping protein [Nocardioides sp.]|nr:flagellar hook capping protein [Nocardioides sp.]
MSTMATEGVSGLGSMVPTGTSSQTSSTDKEMFLQLMVAQLRYQDPLNPADTGEFLSQSAQFTALETMQSVAEQTALVVGAQLAFGAAGLVGRDVSYQLEDGTTGSGRVHGVSFEASGAVLDVDGTSVPMGLVLGVAEAAPSTGTAASSMSPTTTGTTESSDTTQDRASGLPTDPTATVGNVGAG